jgi:branched-chain amino acid transport system substrate-binding protein
MVKRDKAFEPNIPVNTIAPHVSMGFNNMWILLNDVLPRAIQKHGGFGPEALAKAARETDIPEGGTMQGYGVKFLGEGNAMRGQNERAVAAVPGGGGPVRHVFPRSCDAEPPAAAASSPWAAR